MEKNIEKTIKNLKKNNMNAIFCETASEVCEKVKEMLTPGEMIGIGGSQTLKQCGVRDILQSGDYDFIDGFVPGLSGSECEERFRKCFYSDTYFASSNAITENGEIYNVDGNSNRVAALLYGPRRVIIVVGKNKIVTDMDAAIKRVKTVAAPKNTVRLNCDTYCYHEGKCMCDEIGAGCFAEKRICCSYTVLSYQRVKNRINVIICGEEFGY